MKAKTLYSLLSSMGNKVFYVEFLKKDGSLRKMQCRFGVKKYLKNGSLNYDPELKGLLPVFDMQLQDYRMINLNSIKKIHADHKVIEID